MNSSLALIVSAISVVLWLATIWASAVCLLRGWSRKFLAARSRLMLITGIVDAVVLLAVVRALSPPPGAWSWLWVVACAVVGAGAAGAARRWPELPIAAPGRSGRSRGVQLRAALTATYVAVGVGVAVVLA